MAESVKRLVGTVVPVGALRSEKSAGVGEFADLPLFARFCASLGVRLVQILPVNDTAYDASPYAAVSAFALNPLYIRVEDLPEAASLGKTQAAALATNLNTMKTLFEKEERYTYWKIAEAKMAVLRKVFEAAKAKIAKTAVSGPLAKWVKANPWVKIYAAYRVLKDENGQKSWRDWEKHSCVKPADIAKLCSGGGEEEFDAPHLFYVWLQHAADTQFSRAADEVAKAGVLLEGDIPILMNDDSADVWASGGLFQSDLSAGAPPDMYSPAGQNWGFPIYDWAALEKTGYKWWKERLAAASRYYGAYRIDHVLGFFRIWATSRADSMATLGRYIPYEEITRKELHALGLDDGRIRWLSVAHIPGKELKAACGNDAEAAKKAALVQVGGEDLFVFNGQIRGEKDIERLALSEKARNYLCAAWANRFFIEYEPDKFSPVWYGNKGRAWESLSEEEQETLEKFLDAKKEASEKIWEAQGTKLLSMLLSASKMLPCAEDLGTVPGCVPRVLQKLGILGLRVVRWERHWDEEGSPYIPIDEYPELTVCTSSVHDSTTQREWWEGEAEQDIFAEFVGAPSLGKVYNPGTARTALLHIASCSSCFRVFPIQDLLHLSPRWYTDDPAKERINAPGTVSDFNWTYRIPAAIEELERDAALVAAIREVASV